MKNNFLFPNKYKKIGWLLFISCFLIGLYSSVNLIEFDNYLNIKVFAIYQDKLFSENQFFSFTNNDFSDELLTIGVIVGGILVGFSKLKNEDEYISNIRYESLVWATYLNYGLIVFFTLFIYGLSYVNVLIYNMITLLLFFIIRFHFIIFKLNKVSKNDE